VINALKFEKQMCNDMPEILSRSSRNRMKNRYANSNSVSALASISENDSNPFKMVNVVD